MLFSLLFFPFLLLLLTLFTTIYFFLLSLLHFASFFLSFPLSVPLFTSFPLSTPHFASFYCLFLLLYLLPLSAPFILELRFSVFSHTANVPAWSNYSIILSSKFYDSPPLYRTTCQYGLRPQPRLEPGVNPISLKKYSIFIAIMQYNYRYITKMCQLIHPRRADINSPMPSRAFSEPSQTHQMRDHAGCQGA